MTKLMIGVAAAAATAAGLMALPAPAEAQAGGGQAQVVVYGDDPCPRTVGDQIVVCTRKPETERYRLPKSQQMQGTRQQRESWAQKSKPLITVGSTGTGSCSAVGPGGYTGCLTKEIQQARQAAKEQAEQNTAPQK